MLQNVKWMYLYKQMNIYLISILHIFLFAPLALPLMFYLSVNGCKSVLTDPQVAGGFNIQVGISSGKFIADINKTVGPDYWTHNYSASFKP